MTRKSKKGIVGKGMSTQFNRKHGVGTGISFKDKNATDTSEILSAIKEEKKS